MNNEELDDNLNKCPHFDSCNQNICPLDLELEQRDGGSGDKCRWMRPPLEKTIHGKVFIAGGGVMPDGLLNCVPRGNLELLNTPSKTRWLEIHKNGPKF